jgi:hypothetical protein
MNLSLFTLDQNLVHGDISIESSLIAPAPYGTYSIRLPNDELDPAALAKIRVILWTCMDRRTIRPVYEQLRTHAIAENEILIISMGGGPIQVGADRTQALTQAFAELAPKLPKLEKIWAVAHTKVCGGVKYFASGRPIVEAVKPAVINEASERAMDPELYITELLVPQGLELLPEAWHTIVEFIVAEPDEPLKNVIMHPQTIPLSASKSLDALL